MTGEQIAVLVLVGSLSFAGVLLVLRHFKLL